MQSKFTKVLLIVALTSNVIVHALSVTISSPANGSNTTNHQPVVTGTVSPNIGVNLTIDGVISQEGNRQTPGIWKIKSSTVLANGTHKAVVTATINGQTVKATSTFTVGPAPVQKLTITSPKNGSTTTNNQLAITGTYPCNGLESAITVNINAVPVGNATISPCRRLGERFGLWHLPAGRFINGLNIVTATATISGKKVTATSKFNVLAGDLAINSPENGSIVSDPLVIAGTAKPNSKLKLELQSFETGKTYISNIFTANASGFWSFTPPLATLGRNFVQVVAASGPEIAAASFFTLVAPLTPNSNTCNPGCR
ncbi:MAG: hypothetical protein P4L22_07905 [Candidatus Babeliales bacterium]|nr:hypothetical protein [Candidatus Babeliales bacterium]